MTSSQIIQSVQQNGLVVLRGASALHSLRTALLIASMQLNLQVRFEPDSDPELVDYLGVVFAEALPQTFDFALIGLFLGALLGRPGLGTAIGLGIGGLVGTVHAVDRVDAGWRILTQRDPAGDPVAVVRQA